MLILMILENRFFYFLFLSIFLYISCDQNKKTYTISGYTQGTTYHIKYHHFHEINKLDIDSLLMLIDMSMSMYVEKSIISLLNQGKDVKSDSLIRKVVDRSIEICYETNGMFDITVAPLVQYWGFGVDKSNKQSSEPFNSSSYLLGCDKISIINDRIMKSDSVSIDLNGIAQGFSVDYIGDYLHHQHGVDDFMVEIGGEVRCVGTNSGNGWKIGIDKPTDKRNGFAYILKLNNTALATSGSYRNYYYVDSMKINHTINPHTLEPTQNNLISATVLYDNCMSADAYATACMSFGFLRAKEFLQKKNISGCLIYVENEDTLSYFSSNFSSFLHRSPGSAPQ